MTPRQFAALITCAIVWGGSFLYVRVLIDAGIDPLGVAAIRTTMGLLTLAPLAWFARGYFPRSRRTVAALAVLSLTNFVIPWTLVATSQEHIPSGVASIVNSAMPLWTFIFAVMLTRADCLRASQVAGLGVGFLGVVALMGEDLTAVGGSSFVGIVIMLVATAFAGGSSVAVRRWMGGVHPLPLTIGQIGFGTLFLVPVALASGAYSNAEIGVAEVGSALALGGLGSGVAVVVFMWLIAQAGAVRAVAVTYLIPPIGVFLGWAVLDEPVGWNLVAGLALTAAGVALVQGIGRRGAERVAPVPRLEPAEAPAAD